MDDFRKLILVVGPSRSGTTAIAKLIASDLNVAFLNELDLGIHLKKWTVRNDESMWWSVMNRQFGGTFSYHYRSLDRSYTPSTSKDEFLIKIIQYFRGYYQKEYLVIHTPSNLLYLEEFNMVAHKIFCTRRDKTDILLSQRLKFKKYTDHSNINVRLEAVRLRLNSNFLLQLLRINQYERCQKKFQNRFNSVFDYGLWSKDSRIADSLLKENGIQASVLMANLKFSSSSLLNIAEERKSSERIRIISLLDFLKGKVTCKGFSVFSYELITLICLAPLTVIFNTRKYFI